MRRWRREAFEAIGVGLAHDARQLREPGRIGAAAAGNVVCHSGDDSFERRSGREPTSGEHLVASAPIDGRRVTHDGTAVAEILGVDDASDIGDVGRETTGNVAAVKVVRACLGEGGSAYRRDYRAP